MELATQLKKSQRGVVVEASLSVPSGGQQARELWCRRRGGEFGPRARRISGGQARRVALAQTLARRPPLVPHDFVAAGMAREIPRARGPRDKVNQQRDSGKH
jgi:ABC-type glutathione transport system ATPase component